jgi:hypothetical protein
MAIELERLLQHHEAEKIAIASLTDAQPQALAEWGMRMYTLGQHVVASIEEIKYDGRLVILDDGSRWEVDSSDTVTAETWSPTDKVAVIDGEMFKLDEFEMVHVEQEY